MSRQLLSQKECEFRHKTGPITVGAEATVQVCASAPAVPGYACASAPAVPGFFARRFRLFSPQCMKKETTQHRRHLRFPLYI